jgi:hypothetical protein
MMILFRITNAYIHDCRIANSAGRSKINPPSCRICNSAAAGISIFNAKNKKAMDIFNRLSRELYFMTDTVTELD